MTAGRLLAIGALGGARGTLDQGRTSQRCGDDALLDFG